MRKNISKLLALLLILALVLPVTITGHAMETTAAAEQETVSETEKLSMQEEASEEDGTKAEALQEEILQEEISQEEISQEETSQEEEPTGTSETVETKENPESPVNDLAENEETLPGYDPTSVLFTSTYMASATQYPFEYDAETKTYTVTIPDLNSALWVGVKADEVNYELLTHTNQQITSQSVKHGQSAEKTNAECKTLALFDSYKSLQFPNFIITGNKNDEGFCKGYFTVTDGDVTETFYIDVVRGPLHLKEFTPLNHDLWTNDNYGTAATFDPEIFDYTVQVSPEEESFAFSYRFLYSEVDSIKARGFDRREGYVLNVKNTTLGDETGTDYDVDLDSNAAVTAETPLSKEDAKQELVLTVKDAAGINIAGEYHVTILKSTPCKLRFAVDPAEANIYLVMDSSSTRVWPEKDGSYLIYPYVGYRYNITCPGYVGQDNRANPNCDPGTGLYYAQGDDEVRVSLAKAKTNRELDISLTTDWSTFRGNNENNGVVDYPTPIKSEDAVMYWASKIGNGYDTAAAGSPILVDGYLYTYAADQIFKVDTITGEIVASGKMVGGSSFAINNPTYADGMIFIALSGGVIQAFNAVTLESVWVYEPSSTSAVFGGQPNCPIAYCDGYIYTGFWNSETKKANFVCLTTTDEDPDRTDEIKIASWCHVDKGFYWAGAYACEDFVLVGTDDGNTGWENPSDILSLDPKTGKILDRVNAFTGDIRSGIAYDKATDAYYFTDKGGEFCRFKVNADGTIPRDSIRIVTLSNGSGGVAMSTSTPAIYNGRAYIGVCGTGQFTRYSGHNITVIDLETMEIAYRVETSGYPQTSAVVTTAYDKGDGTVYVYFLDNYTPGMMRVIKDRPGQTEPDPDSLETETYTLNGQVKEVSVARTLFTPAGVQSQYCICSPVVDASGTMYFKNDTGYMMAVGFAVDRLEIAQKPAKTVYQEGETFHPSGMKVNVVYQNGTKKDISKYITYYTEPLTEDDDIIDIGFSLFQDDADIPYQDTYQDGVRKTGVRYHIDGTSIKIKFKASPCAGNHNWGSAIVTKKASYTEKGEKTYYCTVCGAEKTEVIPQTELFTADNVMIEDSVGKAGIHFDVAQKQKLAAALQATYGSNDDLIKAAQSGVKLSVVLQASVSKDIPAASSVKTALDGLTYTEGGIAYGVVKYYDLTACLVKKYKNGETEKQEITSLNKTVDIRFDLGDASYYADTDYYVIPVEEDVAKNALKTSVSKEKTAVVSTDTLGTYALGYIRKTPKTASAKFSAVLTGETAIYLSWTAVPGVSGYRIYYAKKGKTLKLYKSLTGTSLTFKGLAKKTGYQFKVVPYLNVKLNSSTTKTYVSKGTKSVTAITLAGVSAFKIKKAGKKKIRISWGSLTAAKGYQIYQSTKKSKGYKLIRTVGKVKKATITVKAKKKYYYKIRAYALNGKKKVYGSWSKAVAFKLK